MLTLEGTLELNSSAGPLLRPGMKAGTSGDPSLERCLNGDADEAVRAWNCVVSHRDLRNRM